MTEPRAATGRSGTGRSGTGAGDALRIVRAEPLTPAAFAPFGVVLEAAGPGRAVNGGTARRSDAGLLCLVHEDGSAADCEEVTLGAAAFAVAIP